MGFRTGLSCADNRVGAMVLLVVVEGEDLG
jgi:hypothetical protein